jgi:hypothetical protein
MLCSIGVQGSRSCDLSSILRKESKSTQVAIYQCMQKTYQPTNLAFLHQFKCSYVYLLACRGKCKCKHKTANGVS